MTQRTITVANTTELNNALATATGGETILLASGDYGKLNLSGMKFSSNVTLKSADATTMASFSEAYVKHSSNITFDTIKFDYNYSTGETYRASKFRVENSSDITFTNSLFDGDVAHGTGTAADGLGSGKGLIVKGSTNVDIVDSEFHSWWTALTVNTSSDIHVAGNNIHGIRSDGMKLGSSQTVLVEKNYIHDFDGAQGLSDHRDMIQIMRSSGTGVSDLTIRDNIFDMGSGIFTQTIWAGRDKANSNDPTHWHQNVLIENNVIYNAHSHGIAFDLADGLTIRENSLIAVDRAETGGITIPKINVTSGSKNVTIENNIAPGIIGENGQSDWNVQNNALIQNTNQNAPGFYDDQFIYNATAQADGSNQFQIAVGSMVDQLNAGSSLNAQPSFSYDAWVGNPTTSIPNSGSAGAAGSTGGSNTGASSAGQGSAIDNSTNQDNTDTGTGGPILDNSDIADSGTGSSGSPQVGNENETSMTFDDFVLDIAGLPTSGQADLRGNTAIVNSTSGSAIQFDGQGDAAKLGRLAQFEDSEQIAFKVDFARDQADGSEQRLVWNHRKIGLSLNDDGLVAHVRNNDDPFHKGFRVDNLGLNDTEKHTISLLIDQESDRLQIIVDDRVVLDKTDTDFDFVGGDNHEWGWTLGGSLGRLADGEMSGFAIDADVQFTDQFVIHDDLFA